MENKEWKGNKEEIIVFDDEKDKLKNRDYDGIKELNNPAPPWLMAVFYIAIVFAAFYMVIYHVTKAWPLQDQEYLNEVAKADEKLNANDTIASAKTEKMVFLTDAASIAEGKEIFTKYTCVTCHGDNAEGKVGPNMTDDYWIYGNTIEKMFEVITNGNISKGMMPFKDQLKKEQIIKVASYIISLKGTNPPNAKAPQGEKY